MNVHVPESLKTLIDFRLFVKSRHISIVHSCIQRIRDFERSLFVCLLWVCEFFILFFYLFQYLHLFHGGHNPNRLLDIQSGISQKSLKSRTYLLLAILFYCSLHSVKFCHIDLFTKGPNKALFKCKSWTKL